MKKLFPVLVVLAVVALYASFVNAKLKGGDSVEYYRLGQSIVDGQGYTIDGVFVSKWPPITPLVLALGMGVFHAGVAGLKVLLGGMALAGLVIAYFLLRRRENPALGSLAVVLTAVTFPFIYWVMDISSEGPYFCWTMAALLLGQLAFDDKGNGGRWAVLGGLCTGLAFLSRTVGATMIGGFALYAVVNLIRHGRGALKPALFGIILALLLAGGWTLYASHRGGESSIGAYGKYGFRSDTYDPTGKTGLRTSLTRAKENIKGYAFIFSVPDASLRMKKMSHLNAKGLVSLVIMGLATVGYLWHLFRSPQFAECYLFAYAGVLLVFNWYDIRYVVPVLPLLFYYVGWSIGRLAGLVTKLPVAPAALLFLILVNAGISVASPAARKLRSPDYQGSTADLQQAALWIKADDPNAIVMCRWVNIVWFWTRMKVEGIPLIADPEAMWKHMQDNHVTIVIADPDEFSGVTGKFLEPALRAHPDKVELLNTFGQTRVFRIRTVPKP